MNRTKYTISKVARWTCLALLLGGCGSLAGMDDNDLATAISALTLGTVDFTTHTDDACVNGCVGAPNGTCEAGENNFNCAQDCACGDGSCSGTETQVTCPRDCKYGPNDANDENDFCGNSRCEAWEHNNAGVDGGIACEQDCHAGPDPVGATCGNALCEPGETSASCKADCGNTPTCGNGTCEPEAGETFATCDADCTNFNVPAGRFVGTYCSGYDLYSRYADGNGGFVDHLVTKLAGGCDPAANDTAYPWKLISNAGNCNGSTLLKPDGTPCTIAMANCNTDATWATLGAEYEMAQDPNKCGTYRSHNSTFQPLEWSKVGMKDCTQGGCLVYQCGGQSNTVTTGFQATWRPQIARWSIYANKCQ
ncbi:MAG TPA: hypothetical protein PK156_34960 [Polyangium sp.]|nr:hypothetical protein [Polyangium sp.]